MSLTPGTRLGPYEIGQRLGAGGMGEVYRARDANLNRDVALKVRPTAFALDADRFTRFRRQQCLGWILHDRRQRTVVVEADQKVRCAADTVGEGIEMIAERCAHTLPFIRV